jgi:hypothetical protein
MSQYFDYFRARDAATANSIAAKDVLRSRNVDSLSLKGFDADVRLGLMLAFATNSPRTVDTVRMTYVWPTGPEPKTIEDLDRLPDNSPWHVSDYFLQQFAQETRDGLASLEESHFERLERDWKPDENFDQYDPDEWRSDFRSIADLAKRARAANDQLFVCSHNG